MDFCKDLNNDELLRFAKDENWGRLFEPWGKFQRSRKGEKKELKIILLNNQKNVWAFFCHMNYCKE